MVACTLQYENWIGYYDIKRHQNKLSKIGYLINKKDEAWYIMYAFDTLFQVYVEYDDGGGNSGDYVLNVENYGDWPTEFKLPETKWYRPKCVRLLPPSEDRQLTLALNNTDAGAPPANVYVTIYSDGSVIPTGANSANITHIYLVWSTKITAIDFASMQVDAEQSLIFTPPDPGEPYGKYSVYNTSGYLVGTAQEAHANMVAWQDTVTALTNDFYDANDTAIIGISYDLANIAEDNKPKIQDCTIVIAESDLINTDFYAGSLVEKGLEMFINYLGLKEGNWGTLIGSFLEYQRDGEFGDLDLPFEVFERRLPST